MGRFGDRVWAAGILILAAAMPADAASSQNPRADELSRSAVAALEWTQPQNSLLWKQLGLPAPSDVRKVPVSLYGLPFKAFWLGGWFHVDSEDRPTCVDIVTRVKAEFGAPLENDGSIVLPLSETQSMKMQFLMYQWDAGKSRVSLICSGSTSVPPITGSPDNLSWNFTISPIDGGMAKLRPRFALRCSRIATYMDGSAHPSSELAIWVDPTMKHVTNTDQNPIADNGSVNIADSRISFAVTRRGIKSDYSIDRYTGSLTATLIQDGKPAGQITGNCEKAASLSQKF